MFGQLFLIVLLSFCFSLGAWAEDFGHIGNMPRFLGERIASVGLCVTGYVLALWVIWRSPVFPRLSENDVMRPLTVKLAPMLVLYCVMVATQSSAVNGRHMMMAGILLAVKLWIEVQALVGARVKN